MPSNTKSSKKTEVVAHVEPVKEVPQKAGGVKKGKVVETQKTEEVVVESKTVVAKKGKVATETQKAGAVVDTKTTETKSVAKKGKVETPVDTPVETKQKAGGKKAKVEKVETKTETKQKAGGKKAKVVEEDEEDGDVEVSKTGKVLRSFKVQLPGQEDFSGRFTGSTPYQAANKALSKYYRTTTNPKATVTFVMRESTRGCRKEGKYPVYAYEGYRDLLPEPVEYKVKDKEGNENVIVKKHKNHLKKVKKADMNANQGVPANA